MKNSKRVTIKEVARVAGVSTQTVSRVINDRPDVAPETRQRVQEIIDTLGYQPSALARSLIQQRSYSLGVVTAGLKFIGPSRTLNGITQRAEELGYALLLKELPSFTATSVQPLLQSLLAHHVDGIIWAVPEIGDNREWLQEQLPDISIPIVFLTMHPTPGISIVACDNYLGGRIATQHLLSQGYHNIGHVSGPLDWWEARQRKAAWAETLSQEGLTVQDTHWVEGNWSSASGEQAFLHLLETYPEMEAVFVGNDQMALSVLQVACRIGRRVPEDLGVVGFDNIAESAYFWPPLTTIFQDQHRLGCTAVEEIIRHIEANWEERAPEEPRLTLFEPEIIVRESSRRSGMKAMIELSYPFKSEGNKPSLDQPPP
jgi:LacI family transcriptional regulator